MTREEAIANLNMISVAFVEPVTKEQRKLIDDTFEIAIKALEQQPCIQEKQANADKIDAVYIDGFKAGYSQARFDLEQEPSKDLSSINPTKTGHWIMHECNGVDYIECSGSSVWFKREHLIHNSYCPNCGLRMGK